jgi:hypothetical protein
VRKVGRVGGLWGMKFAIAHHDRVVTVEVRSKRGEIACLYVRWIFKQPLVKLQSRSRT